jgi:hypothetical protein
MIKLFNSNLELSLRILLTLEATSSPLTLDGIAISDFLTLYAKHFKIAAFNLHGENEFSFTEFALRRIQIDQAIKYLVRRNCLSIVASSEGFTYHLSERGKYLVQALDSQYANEYQNVALLTQKYISTKTKKELLNLIGQEAT